MGVACIGMGWLAVIDTWLSRSEPGSNFLAMLTLALVATASGLYWWVEHDRRPIWSSIALCGVAVSPTVFFYPINVVVVLLAILGISRELYGRPPVQAR